MAAFGEWLWKTPEIPRIISVFWMWKTKRSSLPADISGILRKTVNCIIDIIDPRTGYPAENGFISVTIVSEDGTLADALSTALFIMGPEKAETFWKEHKDLFDAVMMTDDGKILMTKGLRDMYTPKTADSMVLWT